MYITKSLTKYIITMSKVPIKSLDNIALVYYIYDINNKLMIRTNYKMCKALFHILKIRIADIVAFCGIYRYEVWSREQWQSKEWRHNDMNYVIKVGDRYIMGLMGIGGWKFPVTTKHLDDAYDFKTTLEAYEWIRDYGIKDWYVLDYASERDKTGLKNGSKLRTGIGGKVRWE